VDKDANKLVRLLCEMQRLGLDIALTAQHDLESQAGNHRLGRFDRVLLDAPCSGLGVLRRNPDIKWRLTKKNLARYQHLQQRLLENSAPLVKSAGILVYAVCSTEPEENEGVIPYFLRNDPDFAMDEDPGRLPKTFVVQSEYQRFYRTFPYLNRMDGFFLARLKRIQ
jgi:16S rRNA (cytosine967-C5)-methyltransferase